ncbi:MAG: serine hydrolase [Pseudomonadota bacterium]
MKVLIFPFLLLALVHATAESAASTFTLGGDLDQAMADETFRQVTSVLVSVDGEKVYEAYWGEGSATQLNDTRSAMKTLVAMAVGAAIDDGSLEGVESTAMKWFEADMPTRFPSRLKNEITVRDLLTMSSALDCNDNVWESPGNEEHMYPARRWTYFVLDLPTRKDYRRDEAGLGEFAYCTAGSFLLGQLLERATGKDVDRYLAERLFEPLSITEVNWDRSPSGEIMTGGGTELNSRDLLKLGEMLLNGGSHDGEQVLSEAWVKEMMTAHRQPGEDRRYGYQIWAEPFTCGDRQLYGWYMSGNGGNKVAVFAELDLVVVVTATLYGTRGMHQQSADIINDYVLPGVRGCG